jgi:16S rRNA (cytosine1402-N4)-methyltransferase
MTSSLQHAPVLLEEAVDALHLRPDGVYVDCTLGRGGHSRAILARLGGRGRLIALDRDPVAIEAAKEIADDRFQAVHASFAELEEVLVRLRIEALDGLLLDLGVSSVQLDDPQRGFSFRREGPLDMRMDTSRGATASEWLATAPENQIREVIARYGEERFAKQIAAALVAARAQRPLVSTRELAGIVAKAVRSREAGQDPATRTFQAVRIHVNQELAQLTLVLPQAVERLRAGGRLVVISFHSLEDRIVKRFMREQASPGPLPLDLPIRAKDLPPARLRIVGKPIRPGAAEIAANPRARSAIMRTAERL